MTSNITFEIGDTVVLKSGGPVMTVKSDNKSFSGELIGYRCQWFAGKRLEEGVFPTDSLKEAPTESKP